MTYGKVVDTVSRVTTLEECHLAKCQKSAATVTTNLRDRMLRNTVFYGNLLGRFLENNCRACEMLEVNHTYPAVFCLSHVDTVPTMVFVQRPGMVVIRFQRQILYTTFRNQTFVFIDDGFCTTPALFNTTSNRCVQGNLVAIDCCYLTVPTQVDIARMPCPIAHTLTTTKRGAI